MAKMMKMISRPDGIAKMMKAVQGLTKGMSGGGGPLFGGNNQHGKQDFAKMANDIHAMGLDPSSINLNMSEDEIRKKMNELQNANHAMGGKFKKRF